MKMDTLIDKKKEQKREKTIKKETGFKIIRINPDKENFDIDDEISEIQDFIDKSGKKLAEELRSL